MTITATLGNSETQYATDDCLEEIIKIQELSDKIQKKQI